jgi:hypothetical protein
VTLPSNVSRTSGTSPPPGKSGAWQSGGNSIALLAAYAWYRSNSKDLQYSKVNSYGVGRQSD